jgi:predicted permease
MLAWFTDLRVAVRNFRTSPAFNLGVAATVTVTVAVCTVMFSVAHGVVFKPLPFPDSARLLRIYEANLKTGQLKHPVSQGTFEHWRSTTRTLDSIALFTNVTTRFTAGTPSESIRVMAVTSEFFTVLGATPLSGRTFTTNPGARPIRELVLSYVAWQRFLGGAPLDGLTFQLSERDAPIPVVGIMPADFFFHEDVDVWRLETIEVPIPTVVRSWRYDNVVARHRPDASVASVTAELQVAVAQLAREFPSTNHGWSASVELLSDAIVGKFRAAAWLFLTIIVALMVLSFANLAGLFGARYFSRAADMRIRFALGCGNWRIARSWLIETFLLIVPSGIIGIVLAWWALLIVRTTTSVPRASNIELDSAALAVGISALTICLLGCIAGSLFAAVSARIGGSFAHPDRSFSRGSPTSLHRRFNYAVLVVQCGVAVIFVVLAAALGQTLVSLMATDMGWNPRGVIGLHISPRMPLDNRRPWFLYRQWADRLTDRLEAMPSIAKAAITTGIPFTQGTIPAEVAVGPVPVTNELRLPVTVHSITPSYFQTLQIPLRNGRLLNNEDQFPEDILSGGNPFPPGVAVITETVARTLWPGEPALNQQLRLPGIDRAVFRRIVGIVPDVQFSSVSQRPSMHVFIPWAQSPTAAPRLLIRASGDVTDISDTIRAAVLAEDPSTGIDRMLVLNTLVGRWLAPVTLSTQLISLLGVTALLLAVIGCYGTVATVARTSMHDIAVKTVLGASPSRTMLVVMASGLVPVATGTLIGSLFSLPAMSLVRGFIDDVAYLDAFSLIVGCTTVLASTALACLGPALRAGFTDPSRILHDN